LSELLRLRSQRPSSVRRSLKSAEVIINNFLPSMWR
jgi:hypothetical protein